MSTEIEVLGERPAGSVPPSSPLVRLTVEVLEQLGFQPELNASSTDANIPIARGIPAVCVGLSHGVRAHRTDEQIEIAPAAVGLVQWALIAERFVGEARGSGGVDGERPSR